MRPALERRTQTSTCDRINAPLMFYSERSRCLLNWQMHKRKERQGWRDEGRLRRCTASRARIPSAQMHAGDDGRGRWGRGGVGCNWLGEVGREGGATAARAQCRDSPSTSASLHPSILQRQNHSVRRQKERLKSIDGERDERGRRERSAGE